MFLAVGHAALAIDRPALGGTAGLVGDYRADWLGPHFHGASGDFDQVGFLPRIVARFAKFHGPDPSKIGNHNELFHGFHKFRCASTMTQCPYHRKVEVQTATGIFRGLHLRTPIRRLSLERTVAPGIRGGGIDKSESVLFLIYRFKKQFFVTGFVGLLNQDAFRAIDFPHVESTA